MKLSVLVPVYNEERTLEEVVGRVCAFPVPKEIILVDDRKKISFQPFPAEGPRTVNRIKIKIVEFSDKGFVGSTPPSGLASFIEFMSRTLGQFIQNNVYRANIAGKPDISSTM